MGSPGISFDAPLQQATTVSVAPAGVSFDAPTSAATTVDLSQQQPKQTISNTATPGTTAPVATIGPLEQPSGVAGKLERWADNVAHDIEYGTDLTGVGSVLKAMGAHGVYNGNSKAVGDFMASLPLGLLEATKGAAELPQSGKRWQGTKDVTGGLLDASTMPAAFVSPEISEGVATGAGKAADAVASTAGKAAKAAKAPFDLKAVQTELENGLSGAQSDFHDSLRGIVDAVAQDAGVNTSKAPSLRDAAEQTASAIKAKASALYQQLDKAIGGTRFQAFDEQLSNVRRALRNSAGIDPDADGRLVERINDLEDAKAKALDEAASKSVDPNLIHEANSTYRQASALQDLSKHIRASASGLRPELSTSSATANEVVSPAKLATRANRLYDTGRLQQALGNHRADDLLRATEQAKQRVQNLATAAERQTKAIEARRRMAGAVIGSAAGAAGLGGVYKLLAHLLGN